MSWSFAAVARACAEFATGRHADFVGERMEGTAAADGTRFRIGFLKPMWMSTLSKHVQITKTCMAKYALAEAPCLDSERGE